jgi:hypothetical protein
LARDWACRARELARRLLAPPGVPRALEEARAPALELEHRGADRLEEPAVVGDEHDGGVDALQVALEPFERRDVQVVGGLVEEQQIGVTGQRAGERRAGQLAAGEGREVAVEVLVAEAQPVEGRVDALAPGVAAGVLEPRLRARVRVERGRVRGAVGHRVLELGQPRLEREQVAAALQHVVAQGELAVARRALVVQRDAHVLGEGELPAVDRTLGCQHPQQRRLARPVAPGQRHALPALEPEGDPAQQRGARHVLGEVGGDDDGHEARVRGASRPRRSMLRGMRRTVRTVLLAVALLAATAPIAAAHDGGEGLWGETNDKVITNAGFVLIAAFPLLIFLLSMLQWRLDKRKDARKAAAKARKARADVRGGW